MRELYKQATRKNVFGKAKVERRNILTSILLCLAVTLPPPTKFTYLQHSDAYGTTHPHAARGRECYHSQITSSSDIKERSSPYPSCKLLSSSSTTINNTLHSADNSFGLFTFTCERHIFQCFRGKSAQILNIKCDILIGW